MKKIKVCIYDFVLYSFYVYAYFGLAYYRDFSSIYVGHYQKWSKPKRQNEKKIIVQFFFLME